MKYRFLVLFAISLLTFSCKKTDQYMNNAEITEIDSRETLCLTSDPCNCPGGIFISIDNVAAPNSYAYFRLLKIPVGFILGNKFPVAVKLNWKVDSLCSNLINITSMVRR